MDFLIFLILSTLAHFLFFRVSSKSSYEGEPILTDAGKQMESINNIHKWKFISSMHKFSLGKSRMKDMGVLFVLLVSFIFPKFYSFKKLTSAILFANFLSCIFIFIIFEELFDLNTALVCSVIYLFSVWPYMIILHGGYHIIAQFFSLLTIYILIIANTNFDYIMAGFFMCCAMYSSASSRKYFLFIYICLAFIFLDVSNFKSNFLDIKLIIFTFFFIFLWKSQFYFEWLNKFSNKTFNINVSLEFFSKIYTQLIRILILFFFPLLLFYFLSFDKQIYSVAISFFIIGFIACFFIINYPLKLENIVGYLRYTDMSDVAHFNKIRNYFDSINEKIINGMRAEKSGLIWIFKYFLIVLKHEIVLAVIFSVIYIYNNGNVFNLILIFLISITPIIVGETSNGPQIGRSYFPSFIGLVFFIGFVAYNIELSSNIYFLILIGSIYNLYLLIQDIIPSRITVWRLKSYLEQNKINEICAYKSKFYNWILPPLLDMMPNLKINLINNYTESIEKYILIPGQSHKVVNNFGVSEKDFDIDKKFIDKLNEGKFEKNTVLDLKNMGTSKFWMHEDEVSSYRYLLLKDISQNDIKKSFLKLLYFSKS